MRFTLTSKLRLPQYCAIAFSAILLSGCATSANVSSTNTSSAPIIPAKPISSAGLESVLGASAEQLERKFGEARLDVREANGRKLQFSGTPCILDVYLYADGGSTEVATHIDARRSDGAEVDRVSCVKALSRR